tara:strand:- start:13 stop:501 length:489 start_codon:yes stop_codon:yes gene_type:complete
MDTSKFIPDYDNKYLLYKDGRVYSYKTDKFLTACPNTRGYLYYNLSKNRNGKPVYIHRLIAENYILNPHNYPCVDHIDRNRQNNNIVNLRWVTHSMNSQNRTSKKSNTGHFCIVYSITHNNYRFRKIINKVKILKYSKDITKMLCFKYITHLRILAGHYSQC